MNTVYFVASNEFGPDEVQEMTEALQAYPVRILTRVEFCLYRVYPEKELTDDQAAWLGEQVGKYKWFDWRVF